MNLYSFFSAFAFLLITSCGEQIAEEKATSRTQKTSSPAEDEKSQQVLFSETFALTCSGSGCHSGNGTQKSYVGNEDLIESNAARIISTIEDGSMPKGTPLSEEQKDVLLSHLKTLIASTPVVDIPVDQNDPGLTYWKDARPLLEASCSPCHGNPATQGAPSSFVLSRYEVENGVPGVQAVLSRVIARTEDGTMPPPDSAYPMTAAEKRTLVQWAKDGGQEGERPQAKPLEPDVNIISPSASGSLADESFEVSVSFSEVTNQAVWSAFYSTDNAATSGGIPIAENLSTSTTSITWNTSAVASGTYSLYVILSDSGKTIARAGMGSVTVSHPQLGNDFPTIAVQSPNGGETVSANTTVSVTYSASDPNPGDLASMLYKIEHSSNNGANWTTLKDGHTSLSYMWSVPANQSAGLQNLIRVTANDGKGGITSDSSDSVFETVGLGIANPTYANFDAIAAASCGGASCHGDNVGQLQYVNHQTNVDSNEASLTAVISNGSMPKFSTLSAADKQTMLNYLNNL